MLTGKGIKNKAERSPLLSSIKRDKTRSADLARQNLSEVLAYITHLYMEGEISDSSYQTLARYTLSLLVESKVHEEIERLMEYITLKVRGNP